MVFLGFNEHGDASSDDDESSEYSASTDARPCRCLPGYRPIDGKPHSGSCSKRRRQSRWDDSKEIARLFPGVRSLGLVGMYVVESCLSLSFEYELTSVIRLQVGSYQTKMVRGLRFLHLLAPEAFLRGERNQVHVCILRRYTGRASSLGGQELGKGKV